MLQNLIYKSIIKANQAINVAKAEYQATKITIASAVEECKKQNNS